MAWLVARALCHPLADNPHDDDRFKPLAIALLEEQPNASFESAYGSVAKELAFRYDLFLRCGDEWTQLGDNDGELAVTVRRLAAP